MLEQLENIFAQVAHADAIRCQRGGAGFRPLASTCARSLASCSEDANTRGPFQIERLLHLFPESHIIYYARQSLALFPAVLPHGLGAMFTNVDDELLVRVSVVANVSEALFDYEGVEVHVGRPWILLALLRCLLLNKLSVSFDGSGRHRLVTALVEWRVRATARPA